jgi:hypothetical protein
MFFIQTDLAPPLHWRQWLVYWITFFDRAGYDYLVLYRLLTPTRGCDTIFLSRNLLPSNIIPHEQHQQIRKTYE